MKKSKKIICIAEHKPTGAKIPMEILKINELNVIQDYRENLHKRKGFSLKMLQERWNKSREDIIELLDSYQVPGHLSKEAMQLLSSNPTCHIYPADHAFFCEEYIYGIEKKENMKHSKVKPKYLINQTEH